MNMTVKKALSNVWTAVYYFLLKSHFRNGEWKDIQKVLRNSDKKIEKLMKRAYQIPFYRKKFETCGLKPEDFKTREDLTKFPTTTKDEMRDWMESEICSGMDKTCFINGTSGSSGKPLKVLYSIRSKGFAIANWMRILAIHDYNPFTESTMAVKEFGRDSFSKNDSILQKMGLLRRYLYSAMEGTEVLVSELNKHKPSMLYGNKSVLVQMVLYAKENNISLHKPRLICSTSERMDDMSKKLITDYFGDILFQSYGCEEVSAFTYSIIHDPVALNVTWDTHTVLIKNHQGELCTSGNGDIVVTSLYQFKYPVINYELGDTVETVEEKGVTYISKVCGRSTDWFVFKDGTRTGFQPFYYVAVICPYCYQMRYIQEDYCEIRVQAVVKDSSVDLLEAERWIVEKLVEYTHQSDVHYTFEWLNMIPLDKNGKIKFMICNVK